MFNNFSPGSPMWKKNGQKNWRSVESFMMSNFENITACQMPTFVKLILFCGLCYAALLILVPPENISPYRQILFGITSHRDDSYASSLEFFTLSLLKIILNIFHTFLSTKLFPLLESIRIRNF